MNKYLVRTMLAVAAIGLIAASAWALINPRFTPVHLVKQSELIVVFDVPEKIEGGQITLPVKDVLKGDALEKPPGVDLTTASPPEQGEAIRGLLAASAGKQAILFTGEYVEEAEFGEGGFDPGGYGPGPDAGGKQLDAQAFLHVSGRWIALHSDKPGHYQVLKIDDYMEATWAGGTDMLDRAVRYVVSNDDATVPSVEGVRWGSEVKVGQVEGKVSAALPVRLGKDRFPLLFVASDQGDRLFRCDRENIEFEDCTAAHGLTSKSLAAAWGDLNDDGRLDLASWDGQTLTAHLQAGDGTFRPNGLLPAGALKDGCLGLSVVDGGQSARVALVISTPGAPQLLLIKEDRSSQLKTLSQGEGPGADPGPAGACLVADFDGDLLPDLIQPFAQASLFYKGDSEAVFSEAKPCPVRLGKGRSAAFLGDYDADGMLDVMSVSEEEPRLWHNLGEGQFIDTRGVSGEFAYISERGGVGGMSGDVNNDGRQDVMVLYGEREPLVFFNRGFNSFGHAHQLDLKERGRLSIAASGQQAGCLAEFSGYGATDMVLVLDGGEIWAMTRDEEYNDGLYVGVSLDEACPFAGPLTVTAEADGRSLGAWNVSPGNSTAMFARVDAGPCLVKWQLPGGEPQQKEFILDAGPVWFTIK
jgi:hypothetical protein